MLVLSSLPVMVAQSVYRYLPAGQAAVRRAAVRLIRADSSVQSRSFNTLQGPSAIEHYSSESAMRDRNRHCDEGQDLQGRYAKLSAVPWTSEQTKRLAFVRASARVVRNINFVGVSA